MTNDKRIKDLEDIGQVFERYGVRFLVVYGVALGFHRDGDFLPDDNDIDLAVIDPIDLKTRKAIGWSLYDLGFEPQQIAFNVFGRMEPAEIGYNGDSETGIIVCERNFKFTIFFFKAEDCPQHGPEYVCTPKLGAMKLIASPTRFYEKLDTIKLNKKKYLVPGPIEDYLAFTYFDNWKDKTDRRHGDTYPEMHAKGSITRDEVNNVSIK
jgi:hypothetical protein